MNKPMVRTCFTMGRHPNYPTTYIVETLMVITNEPFYQVPHAVQFEKFTFQYFAFQDFFIDLLFDELIKIDSLLKIHHS